MSVINDVLRIKFKDIETRYNDFISKGKDDISIEEKMKYIEAQYNTISSISQIICLSSIGVDPGEQLKPILPASAPVSSNKINIDNFANEIKDSLSNIENMTVKDLFISELNSWCVPSSILGYQAIIKLSEFSYEKYEKITTSRITREIAKALNKDEIIINYAIQHLIDKADFSKGKFTPYLTKLYNNNEQITIDIFLKELVEYIIND